MANFMGTVQCCGTVIVWELYAEGQGFVSLQVWRPVPGEANKYMLVGRNGIRHRSTGISQEGRSIANRNMIHVVPGDIIGFEQKEASVLRYTTCNPASPTDPDICAEDLLINTGVSEPATGDIAEFVSEQSTYLGSTTVRGYAVTAYLDGKNPVSCTDKHKTITDTLSVGDHVTHVHVENMDMFHPNSTFNVVSLTPSLPVALNQQTGEIIVSDVLTPDYPSTDYKLTVRVVDVCSTSSTCTVTITVNNMPKSITFASLPANAKLSDLTKTGHVYDFKISRQRDVDSVKCYIRSAIPDSLTFDVKNISKTEYSVHLLETTDAPGLLEQQTLVIVLVIACENTAEMYNQTTLTLTYQPEESGLGILLTIVGIIATLIVLAMVTVLMIWLCKKGKVKVWPSSASSTSKGYNSQSEPKGKHLEVVENKPSQNGHIRNKQLWDNFSNFYKVEQSITSGRLPINGRLQNGGWDNQVTKSQKSILISQSNGQALHDVFKQDLSGHNHVFQKKPWRP
ncbi:uncharacterized protein LOC128549608 [Mercenaria mercenaria]|uniref:uncharacterized protein LOC128549608 n=1 Tax=Mercenaria mercenaria TaxID=6596 RepID=UPI00234ED190|nr:uncharacterized protein LOC128549608 [Mercenaria mercenaria]